MVEPLAHEMGVATGTLLALLTVPVVVIVWLLVRRIRARLGPGRHARQGLTGLAVSGTC